ncbi:MAG: DUF4302 domain-containing protein [Weeksellaceae bacterium]
MKKIVFLLLFAMLGFSCSDDDVTGISPAQRNKESIQKLRTKLIEAPYGWKVMYFPRMDSLLLSNKDEVLELNPSYKDNFGFGGHLFMMQFNENGTMQMLWDNNETTKNTLQASEFEINQNSYTQLSFTTPNYIHKLVNEGFTGKSDFLYKGIDFQGNLIFKTASYLEFAREYIVFEKVKSENEFQSIIDFSYQNRTFFEKMKNPQITIRRGSRIYFQSDMKVKYYTLDYEIERSERMEYQRYHYFRFNKKPNIITGGSYESNALGSGYVGTETGISFHPGIRFNSTYVFKDFERRGDKYICELVKVYDPMLKIDRIMSKHLAPAEAEFTGYIAEIKLNN